MASSSLADEQQVCLMCLESPAVQKMATCQHAYCKNCMSQFEEQLQVMGQEEVGVFACPACKTQGLSEETADQKITVPDDAPGDDGTAAGDGGDGAGKTKSMRPGRDRAALQEANCKLCRHKGIEVPARADSICKECHELPMCESCTNSHRTQKATEGHVVVPLGLYLKKGDELCDMHDELIAGRCIDCSVDVCPVCVSLDHTDHSFQTMNDYIQAGIQKVKAAKEWEMNRQEKLQVDSKELEKMLASAETVESAVLKNIEEHTDMCIAQILKNKEDLKKVVLKEFQVITTLKKQLDVMPELFKASRKLIARANLLLNKRVELHPSFLEKLSALESEFSKLNAGHSDYEKAKMAYLKEYADLRQRGTRFFPRKPNLNIGGFKDTGPKCSAGGDCVCEVCEKKFKFPNASRVEECRGRRRCQCGTCGCEYDRTKLNSTGRCVGCFNNGTIRKIALGSSYQFP